MLRAWHCCGNSDAPRCPAMPQPKKKKRARSGAFSTYGAHNLERHCCPADAVDSGVVTATTRLLPRTPSSTPPGLGAHVTSRIVDSLSRPWTSLSRGRAVQLSAKSCSPHDICQGRLRPVPGRFRLSFRCAPRGCRHTHVSHRWPCVVCTVRSAPSGRTLARATLDDISMCRNIMLSATQAAATDH